MTADFLYLECDAKACRASDSQVVNQSNYILFFNIQIPSWCDVYMKQTPEDGEIMGCDYTALTATTETATCFQVNVRDPKTPRNSGWPTVSGQPLRCLNVIDSSHGIVGASWIEGISIEIGD